MYRVRVKNRVMQIASFLDPPGAANHDRGTVHFLGFALPSYNVNMGGGRGTLPLV